MLLVLLCKSFGQGYSGHPDYKIPALSKCLTSLPTFCLGDWCFSNFLSVNSNLIPIAIDSFLFLLFDSLTCIRNCWLQPGWTFIKFETIVKVTSLCCTHYFGLPLFNFTGLSIGSFFIDFFFLVVTIWIISSSLGKLTSRLSSSH